MGIDRDAPSKRLLLVIRRIAILLPRPLRALLHSSRRPAALILLHEHVAPRGPVLALPPAADLAVPPAAHDAERPRVVVARVRGGLEAEAALDLQAAVPREVAHVPQRVRLALEQRDDDGAPGREGRDGAPEEGHEELLVGAHLAVHVRALAADVREVEDDAVHDAGAGGANRGVGVGAVGVCRRRGLVTAPRLGCEGRHLRRVDAE